MAIGYRSSVSRSGRALDESDLFRPQTILLAREVYTSTHQEQHRALLLLREEIERTFSRVGLCLDDRLSLAQSAIELFWKASAIKEIILGTTLALLVDTATLEALFRSSSTNIDRALAALGEHLIDPESWVSFAHPAFQVGLCKAFARHSDEPSLERLLQFVSDGRPKVRKAAALALASCEHVISSELSGPRPITQFDGVGEALRPFLADLSSPTTRRNEDRQIHVAALLSELASELLEESERMALLRELLMIGEPAWYSVFWVLNHWQGEQREIAIDYAMTHLATWRDLCRVAPPEWEALFFERTTVKSSWYRSAALWEEHPPVQAPAPDCWPLVRILPLSQEHYRRALTYAVSPFREATFLRTIASSPEERFTHITGVDLQRQQLTATDITGFLNLSSLPTFKHLLLGHNQMDGDGVALLVNWDLVREVETLDLRFQSLGGGALHAIAQSRYLGQLQTLVLDGCQGLTSSGWRQLAGSRRLKQLDTLHLSHCRLGPAVVEILTQAPLARQLRELRVARGQLGDRGAVAIASSPFLKDLVSLDLRHNGISYEAAWSLLDSSELPSLAEVDLRENPFSTSEKEALQSAFPHILV